MKKLFTILLAFCMVVSLSGAAMADNSAEITYEAEHASASYSIDITPTIDLKNSNTGYVNVSNGYWGPYQTLTISAPLTVSMTDSMNPSEPVDVDVAFDQIFKVGSYTIPEGGFEISKAFTVDGNGKMNEYKFGTWTGTLQFEVALKTEANYETVSTAEDLKEILTSFTNAGSGNGIININNDITLAEGETWTPVTIDGYNGAGIITINGNGHTISGLTDTLLAGGFAGNSGIVINDLTIAKATIESSNAQGYGAFINAVDSMPKIELNNCHLKDSTITDDLGARVGGLIGWTAGYNNVGNGPVDMHVAIINCSVTNCTITADGSVGAIIGHAGNNPATYHTITNCVVRDNTLSSTDDGGWRVGVVVGTANVGEVTISGITASGNTLSQTGKTAPDGQSNLYGRFVPGETGKLTIDNEEITVKTT